MTRAMLLCAGLGTRLGPLSDLLPKPLLPVADIAIIRYGVALLVGHGIRDIVINLHYKGELFEQELGDGSALGAHIQYSYEPEILGTGGGLKAALPLLDPDGADESFISMNGKLIVDADLHGLLAAHRAAVDRDSNTLGTMLVQRVSDAEEWGAVQVTDDRRVTNILGKGRHMFCGIHVTRPSVVRRLPEGEACMVRQGYLPWIHAGGTVTAHEHEGYFMEHSTPDRYLAGNLRLVGGESLRYPPGPASGVHADATVHGQVIPPVQIAADAVIEAGATVGPYAVIGAGARVAAGSTVERSVVWPDARVTESVADAIVTPGGVVSAAG